MNSPEHEQWSDFDPDSVDWEALAFQEEMAQLQPEVVQERFVDPLEWLRVAKNLWTSAAILMVPFDDSRRQRDPGHVGFRVEEPCRMLVGFAVECLLKCCILMGPDGNEIREAHQRLIDRARSPSTGKRGPESGRSRRSCDDVMKRFLDHDLVRLAANANAPVRYDQEYLLRKLRKRTVWQGRYPTPKPQKFPEYDLIDTTLIGELRHMEHLYSSLRNHAIGLLTPEQRIALDDVEAPPA